MQPNPAFWADKRVCVTGGTGFLGWTLVRELLPLARHVRILGLKPANRQLCDQLDGVDCVFGDVRDPFAVRRAVGACDVVFHTAGNVAVWGAGLAQMHAIHLDGTRQVLQALAAHARMVHTSSIVAVGATRRRQEMTESSPFDLQRLKVDYVHAKKAAEDLALRAAAQGTNVVVVNPAYLIGPNDYEGSVMGRFSLRVWKGRVPLVPPGGWNLVDVRDVARGQVLAAERGVPGRRYILGGDNLSVMEFVRLLNEVRGGPARWALPMPGWLNWTIACIAELRAHLLHKEPYPGRQHVRLNRYFWYCTSTRAARELGYRSRPVADSLADAHRWFCDQGLLQSPPTSASRRAESVAVTN